MVRTTLWLLSILLSVLPSMAVAGPFGLNQGTPLTRLEVIKKLEGEYRYQIRVPTPLSDFELYIATVTPREGLCRVAALGVTLQNDSDGSSARARYGVFKNALTNKYGNSREFDFVHPGALFEKESEFAMAVHRKERTLASFWDAKEHSNLPPDISGIELDVRALSSSATYVNLTYEFANFRACTESVTAVRSEAI